MENKKIKEETQKKQLFVFYSVPCRRPFVVSREKAEEFKQQHTSRSDSEFVKRLAETFRKNILVEEGPVLKKVRKPNSGEIIRK